MPVTIADVALAAKLMRVASDADGAAVPPAELRGTLMMVPGDNETGFTI